MNSENQSNNDDFPYRNYIFTDIDRISKFKNLINYDLPILKSTTKIIPKTNIIYPNIYFLYKMKDFYYMPYNNSDFMNVTILSDMFNDICRSKCGFGNSLSPYEYFKHNKDKLIDILKKKRLEINNMNLREEIYYHTVECSVHNPGIIKKFIELYDAKKILDMSCGWGDRLLGAMAANNGILLYEGTDPNSCLHPNYNDMVKLLLPLSPNPNAYVKMICSGFETYNINNDDYYDLVYTSPPYFDYEKYSTENTQSHKIFNTENSWFTHFLQVSINKCIKALKYKGHLVLYFSQEKGKTYMEKFLDWMKYVDSIYYLGCIYYCNHKFLGTHPIFIYKKMNIIPKSLYNPKITIQQYIHGNVYNVIHDDHITGGSLVRGCVPFLQKKINNNINHIIHCCYSWSCEQLSIAYSLYLLKKKDIKLTIICDKSNNEEIKKIHDLTIFYHSQTTFIYTDDISNYVYSPKKQDYVMPYHFLSEEFEYELYNSLSIYEAILKNIDNLWISVPSTILLIVLLKLLPNTHFNVVNINNTKMDNINTSRMSIYNSNNNVIKKCDIKYNTTLLKDGKIWEFLNDNKMGKDNDYIWNSTGAHNFV